MASLSITPEFYLILSAVLALIFRKKRFIHFLTLTLTIFFITGVLKIVVGRARPDFFINTGFYGCSFFEGFHHNFRSFPSSHAAIAFGIAYLLNKRSLILYLIAALLTSSRLLLSAHYLSDVVAGALIGILAAKLAPFLTKKIGQVLHLSDPRLKDS